MDEARTYEVTLTVGVVADSADEAYAIVDRALEQWEGLEDSKLGHEWYGGYRDMMALRIPEPPWAPQPSQELSASRPPVLEPSR
jgi:hypothetical protein